MTSLHTQSPSLRTLNPAGSPAPGSKWSGAVAVVNRMAVPAARYSATCVASGTAAASGASGSATCATLSSGTIISLVDAGRPFRQGRRFGRWQRVDDRRLVDVVHVLLESATDAFGESLHGADGLARRALDGDHRATTDRGTRH